MTEFLHIYRPQTKLRKGNVFIPVSHSVNRAGVYTPWADTPHSLPSPVDGTHPTGMHSCYNISAMKG